MLLGYARVSKADGQDTAAQVTALRAAGCERVYEDRMTGARWDRPELQRLLQNRRERRGLRPQHDNLERVLRGRISGGISASSSVTTRKGGDMMNGSRSSITSGSADIE